MTIRKEVAEVVKKMAAVLDISGSEVVEKCVQQVYDLIESPSEKRALPLLVEQADLMRRARARFGPAAPEVSGQALAERIDIPPVPPQNLVPRKPAGTAGTPRTSFRPSAAAEPTTLNDLPAPAVPPSSRSGKPPLKGP